MRSLALVAVGLLLFGCGGSKPVDHLVGDRVGPMAEEQLEALHSGMAPGKLACPDLPFRVGASVRCVRTASLSGGREIRMLGTVTVTSVRSGGKVHVKLDDDVSEYGINSEYLEGAVRKEIIEKARLRPDSVDCPYLQGPPGTGVGCWAEFGDNGLLVRVTVSELDPATYTTRYTFVKGVFDRRTNLDLPLRLKYLRTHGWAVRDDRLQL